MSFFCFPSFFLSYALPCSPFTSLLFLPHPLFTSPIPACFRERTISRLLCRDRWNNEPMGERGATVHIQPLSLFPKEEICCFCRVAQTRGKKKGTPKDRHHCYDPGHTLRSRKFSRPKFSSFPLLEHQTPASHFNLERNNSATV